MVRAGAVGAERVPGTDLPGQVGCAPAGSTAAVPNGHPHHLPHTRLMTPWTTIPLLSPFSAHETISGLVLKENHSVVKSVRNLDAKCEVQMCPCTFCS